MRLTLRIFGVVVVLASVYFLISGLVRNAAEIPPFGSGLGSLASMVIAILNFALGIIIQSYAWVILLRGARVNVSLRGAYSIVGRAQIAKYFPGNVFHFVGRVVLGVREGIAAEVITLSMGVETLVAAVTAGLIGFCGILLGQEGAVRVAPFIQQIPWIYIIGFVATAVAVMMIVGAWNVNARSWIKKRLSYLDYRGILGTAALYAVILLVNGCVIKWLLVEVWGTGDTLQWYDYSWGFSIAWLLGFIVPGAPGGIGVREAVILALYGPLIGNGIAAGLAVLLRVITSISELISFGIASYIGRHIG